MNPGGTHRPRMLAALLAALALTLAACASDTGGSADTEASEPAAAEPSEPAAAEPSEPAAAEPSVDEALVADVPEVDGATQQGQEDIQEGGIHFYGTVEGAPADIVAAYQTALEKNGWTVEGSGGDPSGELGAGVQATRDDGRYLSLNVGGPGEGTAFGDLCVWPAEPDDNNCQTDDQQQDQQDQQQDDGDGGDGGPPEEVRGFIPDEVEQFIP